LLQTGPSPGRSAYQNAPKRAEFKRLEAKMRPNPLPFDFSPCRENFVLVFSGAQKSARI
jgi:hypothetical protein